MHIVFVFVPIDNIRNKSPGESRVPRAVPNPFTVRIEIDLTAGIPRSESP